MGEPARRTTQSDGDEPFLPSTDATLDEALDESFPASDPPAVTERRPKSEGRSR